MTLTLTPRAERCRVPLQTGAAAGLAWWIATRGLGDATPLCAPVVAVISIGATMSGRWRRTVEVILGLTIGIGLATLLVSALGHGALMLAVLVTAAMLTADAARGGELLVMQAGIAATLVFAGHVESANSALSLVVEALTGAGCALLVSLFVLPPDPTRLLRAKLDPLVAELARVLDDIAAAIRAQDGERAATALERARATTELVDELHATRPVAVEIARFVPTRRSTRQRVSLLDTASVQLDHAVRNARVIARAALALLAADTIVREACATVASDIADAVRQLDWSGREPDSRSAAAKLAGRAADRLADVHAGDPSLPLGAIAAATRGLADDLAVVAAGS